MRKGKLIEGGTESSLARLIMKSPAMAVAVKTKSD